MADDPILIWNALEQSGEGDGTFEVASKPSGFETGFGPVRYALGPDGERRLLIPCGATTSGRGLVGGPKLLTALTSFTGSRGKELFIDILCRDRRLDVVFAELCGEILKRLMDGFSPLEAASGTISEFRELLLSGARKNIPLSEVAGLIGELIVLGKLNGSGEDAISAWTGPFQQRHDFRRGVYALEVKCSLRSDKAKVSINGSDQLLAPLNGELWLAHIRIESSANGSLQIRSLFRSLVASGINEGRLRTALAAAGCEDPESEDWNACSFELEGLDAYEVTEGFPRISPDVFPGGKVPEAISEISYSLDLSAARKFCRPENGLNGYITEMMK